MNRRRYVCVYCGGTRHLFNLLDVWQCWSCYTARTAARVALDAPGVAEPSEGERDA